MKTPEDEAFDDLARKQGAWGGGFPAKRAMAADKLQEPAQESANYLRAVLNAYGPDAGISLDQKSWSKLHFAIKAVLTQPSQRQWIWLSDADIAEVVDTTCQYTGSYEEYLIKKAERKSRSINNG